MATKDPGRSPAPPAEPAEEPGSALDPLDEALEETFPASDPIAPSRPGRES